jgi:hypothetical protein
MMHARSDMRRRGIALALTLAMALAGSPSLAQQEPRISDAEEVCIVRVPYPLLDAQIEPPTLEVVRLYFRAAQHPDFYWVAMHPGPDGYFAVLPTPSPETEAIVYYVEAVTPALDVGRTPEITARVVDDEAECEDDPAGIYPHEPDILVGTTVPGAPPFPPGFDPTGIVGAIAAPVTTPSWVPVAIFGGVVGGILVIDRLLDDDEVCPPRP